MICILGPSGDPASSDAKKFALLEWLKDNRKRSVMVMAEHIDWKSMFNDISEIAKEGRTDNTGGFVLKCDVRVNPGDFVIDGLQDRPVRTASALGHLLIDMQDARA